MRRGVLKQSELIKSISWDNNVMEVEYRSDGAVFRYQDVPFSTFKSLVRSKHPGEHWLKIRDQFKNREVS